MVSKEEIITKIEKEYRIRKKSAKTDEERKRIRELKNEAISIVSSENFTNFGRNEILRAVFGGKNNEEEKFYKTYDKNKTQLPIPHIISRNNPYLLTPEELKKNEEFKINSYWSSFILQATEDAEIFEPNDIKNLLAILSVKSAYIEHLKKEKLPDEGILKILVIDGFIIPLPMVAEIREISKRKENYQRIINSIDKAQKIQIKGKLSVDIKGEPLEVKKAFSFISEYEEITYKNKKALNIKLSPTVAKLLIEKKGRYYNRKLINNIPDNLLPLYFTLDNFRLNQNIKEKIISKKDLLENSRLIYGKTAKERPDKVEKYLKKKLNKLKNGITIDKDTKIKLIKDWKEVEMYNGEKGIKIIYESKTLHRQSENPTLSILKPYTANPKTLHSQSKNALLTLVNQRLDLVLLFLIALRLLYRSF